MVGRQDKPGLLLFVPRNSFALSGAMRKQPRFTRFEKRVLQQKVRAPFDSIGNDCALSAHASVRLRITSR